ncbi:MAG: hypothetical protein HYZ54_04145 [Ignavibacteriae bacterium]|nr:hypothetical protein [Ignavibacteriota bacterium]
MKYAHHPKTPSVKKPSSKRWGKKGGKEDTKGDGKGKSKRTSPTFELSKELSDLLGEKRLSRGEVTKKVWDYIKSKKLQDPKNKRLITPDAKLSKVFGSSEPVDMFKLSGILGKHLKS